MKDILPPSPDEVPILTDEEIARNPDRKPEWYHTRYSSPKVKVYYGEHHIPFVIDLGLLSDVKINKMTSAEVVNQLDILSRQSEDPYRRLQMPYPQINPQAIRRPENTPQPTTMPTKGIKIRMTDVPFGVTMYFHEIFVNEPFIVLAFNKECIGVPAPDLDPGAQLKVVLQDTGQDYLVQSLGLVFSHNSYDYYILLETPSESQQESKVKEVKESTEKKTDL